MTHLNVRTRCNFGVAAGPEPAEGVPGTPVRGHRGLVHDHADPNFHTCRTNHIILMHLNPSETSELHLSAKCACCRAARAPQRAGCAGLIAAQQNKSISTRWTHLIEPPGSKHSTIISLLKLMAFQHQLDCAEAGQSDGPQVCLDMEQLVSIGTTHWLESSNFTQFANAIVAE